MMDFSSICRTCLGTGTLSPIFNETEDHERHSADIFINTGIKINLNDGFPQQMCVHCVNYLNSSLKFRQMCKDTETKLLQLKKELHSEKSQQETEDNTDNILNIEVKCEYNPTLDRNNSETIKLEDDSDLENDTPLSCLSEKNHNQVSSCETYTHTVQLEKERKNGTSKIKKEVQRVSCPICHKDLSPRSLRAHVEARHGARHRCGYCKREYGSKEALAAHAPSCPLKTKRRGSESGKELVKCEVCHKAMQRASLRTHVAVKHRGLGPVCEHCGRRFGNKLRLSEHLRAKHGYEKFRCAQCEFTSASSAALQNHERRHRGEKPFVCETCGAKFHAAYLLAQHRQSHRSDKRVKCGLCGAVFKAANSLHAHRLARHGARRHRCPLCARAYSCRHYAVKHLRSVHGFKRSVKAANSMNARRHRCPLCARAYSCRHYAVKHLRSVHGFKCVCVRLKRSVKAANSLRARRHRCPLCARAYSCRHYAVKHLRSVHGFKGTVPPLRVDPVPPS